MDEAVFPIMWGVIGVPQRQVEKKRMGSQRTQQPEVVLEAEEKGLGFVFIHKTWLIGTKYRADQKNYISVGFVVNEAIHSLSLNLRNTCHVPSMCWMLE